MKLSKSIVCVVFALLVGVLRIFPQSTATTAEEVFVLSYPLDKTIELNFVPEANFSGVGGKVEINLNERGEAHVKAEFKALPSVFDIGSLYASYVFWAVLPDGTTQNLGEIKTNPKSKFSNSSFEAEVRQNTFGMFVTVEPHYLVRQPGKSIVLKNAAPVGKDGQYTKSATVECALNEDYFRSRPKLDKKKEKELRQTPITVIAAQNAVALARYAGAETYSPELYNEAFTLLEQVQQLKERKAKEKEIDLLASKTIGIAANAEKKAIEAKAERISQNEDIRNSRILEECNQKRTNAETKREFLEEELAKTRREKEILQRDFDEKYSQSIRLERENKDLKARFDANQNELNTLKVKNEKLQREVDKIRYVAEFKNDLPLLEKYLSIFGAVERREGGLMLTLANNIWSPELKDKIDPAQMEKLQPLFKKIGESKYLQLTVVSFVNSAGDPLEAQELADFRAREIAALFASNGVETDRIATKSFLQNQVVKAARKTPARETGRVEISFKLVD